MRLQHCSPNHDSYKIIQLQICFCFKEVDQRRGSLYCASLISIGFPFVLLRRHVTIRFDMADRFLLSQGGRGYRSWAEVLPWKISTAIFVATSNAADKHKDLLQRARLLLRITGRYLHGAARLRVYLEFWSRVAPLIGPLCR